MLLSDTGHPRAPAARALFTDETRLWPSVSWVRVAALLDKASPSGLRLASSSFEPTDTARMRALLTDKLADEEFGVVCVPELDKGDPLLIAIPEQDAQSIVAFVVDRLVTANPD